MKKKTITALIAALTITSLTACGGPKQLSKSVTVELGKEDGIKITDILDISKDDAKDAKLNTKKVDFFKEGSYDATVTYKDKDYDIKVKIKDTTAPEATAKDNIVIQTGTALHVTDCLDNVTEASGNITAKFKTTAGDDIKADDTASTEATETASNDSTTEAVDTVTESTETSSSAVFAVGEVNLTENDEITYTKAGDYDNTIVVIDEAGNSTDIDIKITVMDPPAINGVTDKTVTVGDSIDYMAGVTATDGKGNDLTGSVEVDSSAVNTGEAGTYSASYKVTDSNGFTGGATSNITVNEPVKEEPKQEVADNEDSDNSGSNKNNGSSSSKKHNSSSSGSSSSGSNSSSGNSSSSGGSSSNSSGNSSSGGSSSGSSSSNASTETPINRSDVPSGWILVDVGVGKVACNPNAWKYDTAYAGNSKWGLWADGSRQTLQDRDDAMEGGNRDAALYYLAAGSMDQVWFDQKYGQ